MNLLTGLFWIVVWQSSMPQLFIGPANATATAYSQQASAVTPGAGTAARVEAGEKPDMAKINSTVEHEVLVVRHSSARAAGAAEAPNSAPDSLVRATGPGPEVSNLSPMKVDNSWRYPLSRRRSPAELELLQNNVPKPGWRYHPMAHHSQEHARHHWTYHPSVRKGWQRQRIGRQEQVQHHWSYHPSIRKGWLRQRGRVGGL